MEKPSFFEKLSNGLTKTRENLSYMFANVFSGSHIDDAFYDELEEALIISDVGSATTDDIIKSLRSEIRAKKLTEPVQAKELLKSIIANIMTPEDSIIGDEKAVLLIVGVNGVGKTTTVGKLAEIYKAKGKSVILAAADTFRAAAAEQLTIWGERAKVPVIKQGEGADPAAVVFDAVSAAKARNADILIIDTAGRLHNKKNLMQELGKINRVLDREYTNIRTHRLLVLDATTGQNAIVQAKVFVQTIDLNGIILTKLDGTAKGGVVIAVKKELGIPVRFIGVGEGIDDLQVFDPVAFASALFEDNKKSR